jgi:hypothetical protein
MYPYFKTFSKKIVKLKNSKLDSIFRWTAAICGVFAALFTGSAVIEYQAWGWTFAVISSSCWFYAASVDLDKPRALMNMFYVVWSIIAIFNWVKF